MAKETGKPYVLSVDIGTTGTKALVIRRDGTIMASHSVEYPLHAPQPDRAEQDPEVLFEAVITAVGQAVRKAEAGPEEILCVSFSSAMHGLIAMDEAGNPLTRNITWADNRSAKQAERINKELGGLEVYLATGTPVHPMSPLAKLLWLKEMEPEIHKQAYKFIGIKEYVFYKLFGRYIVDHSIASATGLFNLERFAWDKRALSIAGIEEERLSELVPCVYRVEGLSDASASAMGLAQETPFVVGASDGVLASLGSGAIDPGVVAVSIGTSGAVRAVVNKPSTDPQGRLFCYALDENFWVIGGPINNGGIMFRWVRDTLATLETEEARRKGIEPYDYLAELAAEVPAGSDGLLFLPLLSGERAPYWNPNARGVFFGLSLYHEKKQMIRSVLEGVMFRIDSVIDAMRDKVGEIRDIRASGGFARSSLWLQILSDVTAAPVTIPDVIEASGLGAAQVGLLAMGEIKDFSGIREWVALREPYNPNPANHEVYKRLTPIYQKVYHQLSREFDAISAFQNEFAASGRSG